MFDKETYVQRRALLKKNVGSGVLLFLGNDEQGLNYEDNAFRYRQDSTFLYYFGLSFAGLSAIIDIDENKEIIFGDELTIDHIVWMGTQPTLKEKSERVGIRETLPSAGIISYLHKAVQKGQTVHYLPPYRPEHKLKLMDWLGVPPARQEGSVPFIRAVVAQRNYKSAEEIAEIEKACDVTADMHIKAMEVIRPGMYEYEVVAEMNRVAEMNNCELSFPTIATINGQTLHNHYHGNKIKSGDLFLIDAGAELPSGYCGDMSSTVPADKTFTSKQRAVYEIQNAMHLELSHPSYGVSTPAPCASRDAVRTTSRPHRNRPAAPAHSRICRARPAAAALRRRAAPYGNPCRPPTWAVCRDRCPAPI